MDIFLYFSAPYAMPTPSILPLRWRLEGWAGGMLGFSSPGQMHMGAGDAVEFILEAVTAAASNFQR